jgi:hypothetical protein
MQRHCCGPWRGPPQPAILADLPSAVFTGKMLWQRGPDRSKMIKRITFCVNHWTKIKMLDGRTFTSE